MIDYEKINSMEKFNSLSSPNVWDHAGGLADYEDYDSNERASVTANKTSVYLFNELDECVCRMVNISTTNIDGVDDKVLEGDILRDMVTAEILSDRFHLRMNRRAYSQLLMWWWNKKECKEPEAIGVFAGAVVIVDDTIPSNQETVI